MSVAHVEHNSFFVNVLLQSTTHNYLYKSSPHITVSSPQLGLKPLSTILSSAFGLASLPKVNDRL